LAQGQFGQPVDSSNGIYDVDCDNQIGFVDLGRIGGYVNQSMRTGDLVSGLACADATSTAGNCLSSAP
jgi:hypothetical protein